MLKYRSGHQSPPTHIRHYGDDGHTIISAGGSDKSLRSFSVIRDSQSVELSQKNGSKLSKNGKSRLEYQTLPAVLQFGHATIKENDWDNIVTCHSQTSVAKTWSFSRKVIGKHSLKSPDESNLKSVALSQCGNHVFVGSTLGNIAQYNIQSGLWKKNFSGHEKAITSLCSDALSQRLFSSSLDGRVQVWDISSGKNTNTMDFKMPISRIVLHLDSALLAIVSDDLLIRIVDTDTFQVVREFSGHRNRILDLVCTVSFNS